MKFTPEFDTWWFKALAVWSLVTAAPIHATGALVAMLMELSDIGEVKRLSFPFIEVRYWDTSPWWCRWFRSFVGFNLGFFCFYRREHLHNRRTVRHERRHGFQVMVFGLLDPFLYALGSLYGRYKNDYFANPFEQDAERFAHRGSAEKP